MICGQLLSLLQRKLKVVLNWDQWFNQELGPDALTVVSPTGFNFWISYAPVFSFMY